MRIAFESPRDRGVAVHIRKDLKLSDRQVFASTDGDDRTRLDVGERPGYVENGPSRCRRADELESDVLGNQVRQIGIQVFGMRGQFTRCEVQDEVIDLDGITAFDRSRDRDCSTGRTLRAPL